MKRALVFLATLLLISVFGTTTASAGTVFPDVNDDADYAGAVELSKDMGIFNGDSNGNFNPYSGITRAEFATVVCKYMGGDSRATAPKSAVFQDVPANNWAANYIAWAVEHGIVSGYGNGMYGPNDSVTYEQAIKMLLCAVGCEDEAVDAGGWPYGYIMVADKLGILIGVEDTFGNSITRSNVAVLICNLDNVNFN